MKGHKNYLPPGWEQKILDGTKISMDHNPKALGFEPPTTMPSTRRSPTIVRVDGTQHVAHAITLHCVYQPKRGVRPVGSMHMMCCSSC